MATLSKALFRGAASTSNTTLYTVPAATTAVLTNVIVTNTAASTATFTLNLDGVAVASGVTLAANSITAVDLKQVLAATKTVSGSASATTVNFHISGVEIS
jgi:hypothetical protein